MKLYLVGGTIRRYLLGLPPSKDLDFAVEAPSYESMGTMLMSRGLVLWQKRPEFVTLRGRLPVDEIGMFGGLLGHLGIKGVVDADFTLCRKEAMYSDNRHPDTVTPADLKTDLSRRDFTINAVALSEHGEWIDPFDGREDAKARRLNTIGLPAARFEEDPLRMLRALRFAVAEHLVFEDLTFRTLNKDHRVISLIRTLPVERVRKELNRALQADWWSTMYYLMESFPTLGREISLAYPTLWLKPTTENK